LEIKFKIVVIVRPIRNAISNVSKNERTRALIVTCRASLTTKL